MGATLEIGTVIGKLTIVDIVKHDGRKHYRCKCECGNLIDVQKHNLINRKRPGCGDCQNAKMVGKVYDQLTVLKRMPPSGRGVEFKCRCSCGKMIVAKARKLRNGETGSCGCKAVKRFIKMNKDNALPDGEAAKNALYKVYVRNALKRGLTFDMEMKDFESITKQDCHYCGSAPSSISKYKTVPTTYIYNGIDRVDSSNGYTPDNVVACCTTCNTMKMALGKDEFLAHIERIYNHSIKRG